MSTITKEYRKLSNHFRSIQSLAQHPSYNKIIRKQITKTYPSEKKFTFELKPAGESLSQKINVRLHCKCRDCLLFSKSVNNPHIKGAKHFLYD